MKTRTASCTCGQLTAVTPFEPVRVGVCHCLNCQRRSGSVFAIQARFPIDQVQRSGTSTSYAITGDEGTQATIHFCPNCGTTVWYVNQGMEDLIAIPVGTFADPHFPPPSRSVYEDRRHAWVTLPDGIQHMD
jgi:hypothetical protein